jgi:hypothetical protein
LGRGVRDDPVVPSWRIEVDNTPGLVLPDAVTWTGDVDAVAGVLTSYAPPLHDLIETSSTS